MNISMKKGLLALAGAVALAGAGSAVADPNLVVYKGVTILQAQPGTPPAECTLTLAGHIDENGLVEVNAAGVTGSSLCTNIHVGGFDWTGMLSNLSGAGTVTLSTPSVVVPSVLGCSGTVSGISYSTFYPSTPFPTSFTISGTGNFGSCSLNGTLSLEHPPY